MAEWRDGVDGDAGGGAAKRARRGSEGAPGAPGGALELRLPGWAALGGGQPALALPPSFDELTASGAILLPAFNDVALPVWLMRAGSDCLPAGGTALVSALQAGPDRAVEGASNPRCRERRQHEADACGALPMRDPTTGAPRSPAAGAPAVPAVPETAVGAGRGGVLRRPRDRRPSRWTPMRRLRNRSDRQNSC